MQDRPCAPKPKRRAPDAPPTLHRRDPGREGPQQATTSSLTLTPSVLHPRPPARQPPTLCAPSQSSRRPPSLPQACGTRLGQCWLKHTSDPSLPGHASHAWVSGGRMPRGKTSDDYKLAGERALHPSPPAVFPLLDGRDSRRRLALVWGRVLFRPRRHSRLLPLRTPAPRLSPAISPEYALLSLARRRPP